MMVARTMMVLAVEMVRRDKIWNILVLEHTRLTGRFNMAASERKQKCLEFSLSNWTDNGNIYL